MVIGKENIYICGIQFQLRTLQGLRPFVTALNSPLLKLASARLRKRYIKLSDPRAGGPPRSGNEGTRPMEAPRPKKKRRLLAGTDGQEGREGGGRRRPQSTRTPATWAPPRAQGILPLGLKGSKSRGVQWLDHLLRQAVFRCKQFAECSPVTKRS